VAEKGTQSRIPPARITPAKLSAKILAGEKCLEKKALNFRIIFKAINFIRCAVSRNELYRKIGQLSIDFLCLAKTSPSGQGKTSCWRNGF